MKPQPDNDKDWSAVYAGMQKVLAVHALQRVIRATYDAIYIDEYQDCQREQHAIASQLATMLPCRVLGDPLQRIFEFAGANLSWRNDVEATFPPIGSLATPHRWEQKNPALGRWISLARDKLIAGEPIDLAAVPVRWERQDEKAEGKVAKELRNVEGSVIAIRKEKHAAHHFARGRRGYSSMEEVQCMDLMEFAKALDSLQGLQRSLAVLEFAARCATELKSTFSGEFKKLAVGQQVTPTRTKNVEKREALEALLQVATSNELSLVRHALGVLLRMPKVRIYRHELLYAARDAIFAMEKGNYASLQEAAWLSRSRSRHLNRKYPPRLVSRTLLVKGLEFDHAFVVNADDFTGTNAAQHFYVAISRGSRSLSIISSKQIIQYPVPVL